MTFCCFYFVSPRGVSGFEYEVFRLISINFAPLGFFRIPPWLCRVIAFVSCYAGKAFSAALGLAQITVELVHHFFLDSDQLVCERMSLVGCASSAVLLFVKCFYSHMAAVYHKLGKSAVLCAYAE